MNPQREQQVAATSTPPVTHKPPSQKLDMAGLFNSITQEFQSQKDFSDIRAIIENVQRVSSQCKYLLE